MKVNDFLQKVIFFSGKTQVQAANEAKICPPTFNELCTGKKEITHAYAARLEKVFGIPGVGSLFTNSIINRDYPLIMGITVFFAILLIISVLIVDFIYVLVDPRIKLD